ncbi:MAG: class I SAM-dependent methyltransferase [Paraglaciecola sp.]|uniref:class I SAM-dependent methyltransferase n=1 Tax=Paraglaciecola sp. TaxID=1920173 RepID=UPI0032996BAC
MTFKTNESWDKYWQGTGDESAFTSGGVSHSAIRSFWNEFFSSVKQNYTTPKVLDVASGNGAVIQCALESFNEIPVELSAQDISNSAINNIQSRFPQVKGIISNANDIPKENGSFDVVTSQYGVEYAGHEAIFESARLVANSGSLVLLMHCDSGSIYLECKQNLDAIERTQKSNFIQLSIDMLSAGFQAVKGAKREHYEIAATKLPPAIKELEAIMHQYGVNVAGETISKLYNDVDRIHQRMQHYEPTDVLAWLNRMDDELEAYKERMASMCLSAISPSDFNEIKNNLKKSGFTIQTADKIYVPDNQLPIAWVLIAKKQTN